MLRNNEHLEQSANTTTKKVKLCHDHPHSELENKQQTNNLVTSSSLSSSGDSIDTTTTTNQLVVDNKQEYVPFSFRFNHVKTLKNSNEVRDVKISYKHRVIVVAHDKGISLYNLDTFELITELSQVDLHNALCVEIEPNFDGNNSEALFVGCRRDYRIIKLNLTSILLELECSSDATTTTTTTTTTSKKINVVILEKKLLGSYPYALKIVDINDIKQSTIPSLKTTLKVENIKVSNVLLVGEANSATFEIFDTHSLEKSIFSLDLRTYWELYDGHNGIMGLDVNDNGTIVMHSYADGLLIWFNEKKKEQHEVKLQLPEELKKEQKNEFDFDWGRGIVIEKQSQQILISTTEKHVMTVTDRNGKVLSIHSIPERPGGLCLNRENGQLLVACLNSGIEIFD